MTAALFYSAGASWLNLVERWFAELTNKKLRRGAHRSVRELNKDIRDWIAHSNENQQADRAAARRQDRHRHRPLPPGN